MREQCKKRTALRASGIARRRTEEKRAEVFFHLRATTTAADSRCSRRRSAEGDGGTTLFRPGGSDEDGGNPANIAASGASNQTQRDARAVQEKGSSRLVAEGYQRVLDYFGHCGVDPVLAAGDLRRWLLEAHRLDQRLNQ